MASYQAEFSSVFESVRTARRALVQFAQCAGLTGHALHDFESAMGEALANAAEHGGTRFTVRAEVASGSLLVEVKDNGCGFAGWNARERLFPPSHAPRGFGIAIMRKLMDGVEYSDGGRCIRLVKKIALAVCEDKEREA